MRWQDYVMVRESEFDTFWTAHAAETKRRILFILGRGFDPRTAMGLVRLRQLAPNCHIDLLGLQYVDTSANHSPDHVSAAQSNWQTATSAVMSSGSFSSKPIEFRSSDGRRVAARNSANVFAREADLKDYTDVVVDISAMPRVVYFPLISRLIYFHDQLSDCLPSPPNIHVIVSEDPDFDMKIAEEGVDETASFLHPFEGSFNREAKGAQPAIWIPVLGDGRLAQLDRIYDAIKANEVCPVLPSPARNPRRGDNIVMEYREFLFSQLGVEPRDFIYASEYNPFDVYRQVRRAALHYDEVLKLVGGCRVALSAQCSKLMSIGVLLVAYELKSSEVRPGIVHIECENYLLPQGMTPTTQLVGLWLAGECYQ
jgi:hypothetical protein